MEMAVSIACSLAAALMERVARTAERRSSPTSSTPGSPCRNLRSAVSSRTASARDAGTVRVMSEGLSADSTAWSRAGVEAYEFVSVNRVSIAVCAVRAEDL